MPSRTLTPLPSRRIYPPLSACRSLLICILNPLIYGPVFIFFYILNLYSLLGRTAVVLLNQRNKVLQAARRREKREEG